MICLKSSISYNWVTLI